MSATQLAVRTDGFELAHPGTPSGEAVRFEAVAISPGVYAAQGELEIRVTEEHLPLVAERLVDAQIRDLHEERIQATVGAVAGARVEAGAVVFGGEVALEPHATIVRRFPESIRFSIGFRFNAENLAPDVDGVAELPSDFIIDHIALVGKGQDPDARLTKLLNRAQQRLDTDKEGTTVDEDTIAELRRQRDDALEAEKQARADLAKTESRLETTKDKLDQAEQAVHEAETRVEQAETEAEAARLELERAKAGFATSIMKLELKAGQDVDLHERQQELLEMELSDLDELRLDLAEQAADAQAQAEADEGPTSKPTGTPRTGSGSGTGAVAERTMDLEELSLEDTIRLGLVKEVL